MTSAEQSALYEPQIEAIRSISRQEQDDIHALIRSIADAGYEPAVPWLTKTWQSCPATPIRDAAGNALLAIGSADAIAVLWDSRSDWDRHAALLAIRARLKVERPGGIELATGLVEAADRGDATAARLVNELLRLLAPSAVGAGGVEHWADPAAPAWLRGDERWLDLCVQLRTDERFGDAARRVLRYQPRDRVEHALARKPLPAPVAPQPPRPVQPWLRRYLAGEHVVVWEELRGLGQIVEEDIREEAALVARETMHRVARAVELLMPRLTAAGYPIRPQPEVDLDIEDRLRRLEDLAGGPVPLTIAAFWRVVGAVNLAPDDDADWPAWMPSDQAWQVKLDPLVVDRLEDAWFSVDEWLEDRAQNIPEVVGPLEVEIAPDRFHKVNISGGPPYAIRLPDASADAPIRGTADGARLVEHLRCSIAGGGFAGIGPDDDPTESWRGVVADLTRDLPSF